MDAQRFDSGELRRPERRDDGFLAAEAYLTRAGVFEYRKPDGTVRRELRPSEEVFHADSLKSLQMVPMTLGHPPERVTSQNSKKYQVGTVGSDARQDADFVRASVMVTDGTAIARLDGRRTEQLSCGYRVDLDETPGTHPQFGRYDAIQRNIRYNHCALVPEGRAGSDVRIRLDSNDAVMVDRNDSNDLPDFLKPKEVTMKVRIDGVEYDVSEQAAQAIQKEQSRHDGEKSVFEQKLEAATKAQSEAKGRADAAEAKLKEVEKQRDDALDPEKVRAVAKARATLETEARSILGEDFKMDELSDGAIRREVVSHVLGDRFDAKDADDSYIEGAYRVAVDQAKDAQRSRNDISSAAANAGADGNRADAARAEYIKKQNEASRQPLTAHKG